MSNHGSVYVLNISRESMMHISVNGLVGASSLPGASAEYQPGQLVVGRVHNMSDAPGHFCNGDNTVLCFRASQGASQCRVHIDGDQFPLTQDLVLILTMNTWLLCDQSGAARSSGEMIRL